MWFQFHQNKANAGHFIRFLVLVCLFVLCSQSAMGEKDWLFSKEANIHVILLKKNFAGLLFCKILFFLQCWHTAFNLILRLTFITFRAVFWAQFFGPSSLFPLEFYFLISPILHHLRKIWFLAKSQTDVSRHSFVGNAMQCNAMQYDAMQCNAMQYDAMQYDAIQCNTIQYNTMQYNAMQYLTNKEASTVLCSVVKHAGSG